MSSIISITRTETEPICIAMPGQTVVVTQDAIDAYLAVTPDATPTTLETFIVGVITDADPTLSVALHVTSLDPFDFVIATLADGMTLTDQWWEGGA